MTSTQTILVTPTLGYFGTVFGEILGDDPGYHAALDDGSLLAAFDTGSLLVRLQNDIGTPLLLMPRTERTAFLQHLRDRAEPLDTAISLLTKAVNEPVLNRFRKDLLNGESSTSAFTRFIGPTVSGRAWTPSPMALISSLISTPGTRWHSASS
ncbi:hypothetical protein [Fodinicola feengrottensis]|uniref:hypothetical protein n=1 Tax=Fodinicola feengrottensis TaxID=435914 RepID=UPI0013D0599F|nr:hypothetical protein [Fodinicola feengrottensis]